eukprot:3052432-Pyramimonas_sp.AAC.1
MGKTLIEKAQALPEFAATMQETDYEEYKMVAPMAHGAADMFKLLQHRRDHGNPVGQVPEFMDKFA